jgi:hypothetical protein
VLAEAVQALWPDTQITFGPATDDGFYYDFAPGERGPFTDEDLPAIEAKMREIIAATNRSPAKSGRATSWSAGSTRTARASSRNGPGSCPPTRS